MGTRRRQDRRYSTDFDLTAAGGVAAREVVAGGVAAREVAAREVVADGIAAREVLARAAVAGEAVVQFAGLRQTGLVRQIAAAAVVSLLDLCLADLRRGQNPVTVLLHPLVFRPDLELDFLQVMIDFRQTGRPGDFVKNRFSDWMACWIANSTEIGVGPDCRG